VRILTIALDTNTNPKRKRGIPARLVRILTIALVTTGLLGAVADEDWAEFKSAEGRFTIRMPAAVETKFEKAPDYGGYLEVHTISARESSMQFAVYYHDTTNPIARSERDAFLKKQCNATVRNHNGALRTIKSITVDGNPGREIVADLPVDGGGSAVLRAKVVLVDKRVYQVISFAFEKQADRPEIAAFLDSFKLAPKDEPAAAPAKPKRKRGR
jgi:hypothetical protein